MQQFPSRKHIVKQLIGQAISIPELKTLMPIWPGGMNQNYEALTTLQTGGLRGATFGKRILALCECSL